MIDFDPQCNLSICISLIGEIEDMNVLIQNNIWQSIPVASLKSYRPMKTLQDKGS